MAARTYTLKVVTRSIAKGAASTFKLRLSAVSRTAVRRALRRGMRITARLSVRVADAAANRRTLTRLVRLRL